MNINIQQCVAISPQQTFGTNKFFENLPTVQNEDETLHAIEPNYKELITDATLRRRMSRIIKMGVSASLQCIKESGIMPNEVITATGMGNMTDTERFLKCVIDQEEQLLNPSYFIQSTGNTFGGQTGLMIHSHGYNVTYVHGGFSFESALLDAILHIEDGDEDNTIVTAADEITDLEFNAMKKMGFWRNGNKMGEGAQSFMLGEGVNNNHIASVVGLRVLKSPIGTENIKNALTEILEENQLKISDINYLLSGQECHKEVLDYLKEEIKEESDYKKWCGHYQTASSFGTWMGAQMLKNQVVPTEDGWSKRNLNYILIYSEYRANDYSLILLKK